MSGMKRFLHKVADELGVEPTDQSALDEANRRLGQQFDPLEEWVLTPAEATAIEAAFKRPPSTVQVQKLRFGCAQERIDEVGFILHREHD